MTGAKSAPLKLSSHKLYNNMIHRKTTTMRQAYKILSLILVFTCAISLKALAIDDDGDPGADVPVDGGISLLVAAGVGYGAKQLRKKKKISDLKI